MINPRNIQDVVPCGGAIPNAFRFGESLARQLGHEHGKPVWPIFQRLRGEHVHVASTFGRGGDKYLVRPGGIIVAESEWMPEHEWHEPMLNEFLAEAIGHLFMHYPLVAKAHGENAGMAVRRYGETPHEDAAATEAVQFKIGFLIPGSRVRDACAEGLDEEAIAKRFGVTHRLAKARRMVATQALHEKLGFDAGTIGQREITEERQIP